MSKNFKTKRQVVITGATSGIGEKILELFCKTGDQVHFTYRTNKKKTDKIISKLGKGVSCYLLDQGSDESIEKLCKSIPQKIDVLILNAALGTKTVETYQKEKTEQDLALMKVNALGPMRIVERILPRMRSQKSGKIILISSVDGGITAFPNAKYADGMSKAALTHFASQLSKELISEPIDVFTVCPGATRTSMLEASILNRLDKKGLKEFLNLLPYQRLIEPKEIAELVLFLASPSGQILRGTMLDASLGLGGNPFLISSRPSHNKG